MRNVSFRGRRAAAQSPIAPLKLPLNLPLNLTQSLPLLLPLLLSLTLLPACRASADASPPPAAAGLQAVSLPKPAMDNPMTLERALATRRSIRSLLPDALTLDEVGRLLWAAQGVTDAKGHRTAPSARATYPLEAYLIAGNVTGLTAGLYRYDPAAHGLAPLKAADLREPFVSTAIGQGWVREAPAIVVLTGTASRASRNGELAQQFVHVEAGLAAQGFFLEAVALGLGSTYVGGFKPADAATFLGLPPGEAVLAILPVGRPAP